MSDKFKVVDRATFERMQLRNKCMAGRSALPKIRNSKYKRMSATNNINLMQFVKVQQRSPGKEASKNKTVRPTVVVRNKGKKRENSVKKASRLKRAILEYRKKKGQQAQVEEQLIESEKKLKNLEVSDVGENGKVFNIHSSSFREYCNCCKTDDLKKYCEQFIRELNHFQRRAFAQNETKARAHKRFVVGFRQVQSYLRIHKIKLVIIATDCERNEGGDVSLDETIENIKTACKNQEIPTVFAFKRREMAYFMYKKASISCIGILDYDGARDTFSQLMIALKKARETYEGLLNK